MAKPRAKTPNKQTEKVGFVANLVSWIKTFIGAIIIVMFVNGALIASFVVPTGSMEGTVLAGDYVFVNKFIYGPSTPQVVPFLNTPLPFWKMDPIWEPERNDVIVFIYPGNRDQIEAREFTYFLKRCVAVGGDELQVIDNQIFVNGQKLPAPELAQFSGRKGGRLYPKGTNWTSRDYGPVTIPKKGDVIQLDGDPKTIGLWEVFIQREGHQVKIDKASGTWSIDGQQVSTYTVEREYVFGMGDNRDESLDSRFWGFIPVENIVGTPMFVYWSWENKDANDNEYGFWEKVKRTRLNRVFTGID